jgi:flagellar basal-body rod protein FlgF
MGYGIIETADAMSRMIQKMDHVSVNLANASTAGFKALHLYALGPASLPADPPDVNYTLPPVPSVIDFSKGLIQKTGNSLDMMIESDGFFTIQTKAGTAFTRRGDFTLNRDGQLVTPMGDPVMGQGGPLTIKGQDISVGRDGSIKVDGNEVGKLKIANFPDKAVLKRIDYGYFESDTEPVKNDRPEVAQGTIELSNVNIIKEMVDMIDIQRSFEVYQKVIQTMSDEDKIAVTRVGRLG